MLIQRLRVLPYERFESPHSPQCPVLHLPLHLLIQAVSYQIIQHLTLLVASSSCWYLPSGLVAQGRCILDREVASSTPGRSATKCTLYTLHIYVPV